MGRSKLVNITPVYGRFKPIVGYRWHILDYLIGGLEHCLHLPSYWESSSKLAFIFFRGAETTTSHGFCWWHIELVAMGAAGFLGVVFFFWSVFVFLFFLMMAWVGVKWGGMLTSCDAHDVTLMMGWGGVGGMLTFMWRSWCYVDHGVGWGGMLTFMWRSWCYVDLCWWRSCMVQSCESFESSLFSSESSV